MANFSFRVILPPRPWPFRWGPWGTSGEEICREMDAGTIEIWQRDKKGKDGMVDEPTMVTCSLPYKSSCTMTIEWGAQAVQRRTRL